MSLGGVGFADKILAFAICMDVKRGTIDDSLPDTEFALQVAARRRELMELLDDVPWWMATAPKRCCCHMARLESVPATVAGTTSDIQVTVSGSRTATASASVPAGTVEAPASASSSVIAHLKKRVCDESESEAKRLRRSEHLPNDSVRGGA